MVEETLEQKLQRHSDALVACMAEIERLRAENAALKANATAHQTLKEIYGDSNQPATVRVRAAQAALGHESAPLKATKAPLDLVATESTESLADLVTRQRARMNQMLSELPIEVLPIADGRQRNGNGSDGQD